MKVTQIMLAKGFGGAERSFVDTALSLASRGHQVQAICNKKFLKADLLRDIDGLDLQLIDAGGEWDPFAPRRIAKLLKAFGAEIVHTQLKRAAWHGGRAGSIAGVPVVSKLHNYVDLNRYRHVHALFCTTLDQRRHVLDAGWPESRVFVVPNFSRIIPVEEAKWDVEVPLRVLTYGRYVKKKGFDLLLRAFRMLLDSGVEAELTIGGQGEELDSLTSLAIELDVENKVRLGVWIDDVSSALDLADMFVLPSLDEPFGIVMLEAMARGVPIVSTKTKGPSEVLDGSSAMLVELGSSHALFEGMRNAASNPAAAIARATEALGRYQNLYFEDAALPKIEALYAGVIADFQSG